MNRSTTAVYTSILALLVGLALGVIFADEIAGLISGEPDNIYTLENGKYSYPIGAESDTILVPVDFPPDRAGQPIVFTISSARTGPIFFAANSGSGFSDQADPNLADILGPKVVYHESGLTVEYNDPLNTLAVESTCKVDAAGGGTCVLTPMGTHWEVDYR